MKASKQTAIAQIAHLKGLSEMALATLYNKIRKEGYRIEILINDTYKADNWREQAMIENLKNYIIFADRNGDYDYYELTIEGVDLINCINARYETLQAVKQGLDLFPELI